MEEADDEVSSNDSGKSWADSTNERYSEQDDVMSDDDKISSRAIKDLGSSHIPGTDFKNNPKVQAQSGN